MTAAINLFGTDLETIIFIILKLPRARKRFDVNLWKHTGHVDYVLIRGFFWVRPFIRAYKCVIIKIMAGNKNPTPAARCAQNPQEGSGLNYEYIQPGKDCRKRRPLYNFNGGAGGICAAVGSGA